MVKRCESKGEKIYLDSVVEKKEYSLDFFTESGDNNGVSYYYVGIYVTNNLTETQTFKFSKIYFKTDKDIKVTMKNKLETLTIEPGETNYYYLGCPYYDMDNVKKTILHFKLNKYSFNLHTCLSSYENN